MNVPFSMAVYAIDWLQQWLTLSVATFSWLCETRDSCRSVALQVHILKYTNFVSPNIKLLSAAVYITDAFFNSSLLMCMLNDHCTLHLPICVRTYVE